MGFDASDFIFEGLQDELLERLGCRAIHAVCDQDGDTPRTDAATSGVCKERQRG